MLVNLAVNARDAMPDGGSLTIETSNVSIDENHVLCAGGVAETAPGDYVVLAVSDTGEGMSRETQAHMFEPFFTTKAVGQGTGLGLSTVYGIVRQSAGCITVDSEISRGTTFRVFLPRGTGDVPVQENTKVSGTMHVGTETIMVVDDDDAVRAVAVRILSRAGYTVLSASGPAEAERMWGEYKGPIHLLMTELMMPDMNGNELAHRLLAVRPETRVLYWATSQVGRKAPSGGIS